MITKVLQALANNVRFGAKEPGMRKLNDFMDVNIFGMTRFLQAISVSFCSLFDLSMTISDIGLIFSAAL